jgi:hypothetical protein
MNCAHVLIQLNATICWHVAVGNGNYLFVGPRILLFLLSTVWLAHFLPVFPRFEYPYFSCLERADENLGYSQSCLVQVIERAGRINGNLR